MQPPAEAGQVHAVVSYETHDRRHIYGPTVHPSMTPSIWQHAKTPRLTREEVGVADMVVAADGLKSFSEILMARQHVPPKSSALSIYRTAFLKEQAMQKELVWKRWAIAHPSGNTGLSPGMYLGVLVGDDIIAFEFMPRDDIAKGTTTESCAPKGAIVHWPLLWRDLPCEWSFHAGRGVQVGDSAHSFIPTSGNGGSQALEDAITLATCLYLAGDPQRANFAIKIYNLLRYERVSCAQKMSFVNSRLQTGTDWDAILEESVEDQDKVSKVDISCDPEAYAHEIVITNFFPRGHEFRAWTVEEDLLDGD
ncbi:hypothetical protein BDW66DRAFT_157412 [Aspergillus desertorum]